GVGLEDFEDDLAFRFLQRFLQRAMAAASGANRRAADDVAGQVGGGNQFAFAEEHGPLDNVLQFANIAGPRVRFERGGSFLSEAGNLAVSVFTKLVEERLRQEQHVAPACSERGQLDV